MNINDASALRHCTSCQMCAAVCPKEAISIGLDDEGFYRPTVNADLCVDCSLCVKVCYKFDADIVQTSQEELEGMPLFAAAAKDDGLVESVTSGGVADLLAKRLVAEGYTCIGVGYDDGSARAYHYCAHTAEETDGFRGSKYIQSYAFPALRQLVEQSRKEKFAVFGTPCQIYAVHQFLEQRKQRDRCILVDLYCHGCPSLFVWQKYQKEVKASIRKPKFDRVEFRSKVKGWGNFYVVVVVVDGLRAFVSSPQKDDFYALFFSDQVLNEACSDCRLRSTMAYTDIRLGDFWGKRYSLNTRGMSAVSLASAEGERIFSEIKEGLDCERSCYSDFLPYQSYGRNYSPNMLLRREMLKQLSVPQIPLRVTTHTFYRQQGMKDRLKRYVKTVLYYLPVCVTTRIKHFVS